MTDMDIKDRIASAMFSGMSMSLRDDLCEMLDELWFETATLRAALDAAEARERQAVEVERQRCAVIAEAHSQSNNPYISGLAMRIAAAIRNG